MQTLERNAAISGAKQRQSFHPIVQQHCCSHASMIQSVQTSSLLLFLWLKPWGRALPLYHSSALLLKDCRDGCLPNGEHYIYVILSVCWEHTEHFF